ncbi:hypothetical protein ASF98_02275 [Arthrobacter sp. Leaf337]|uniref:DUF6879 family protein n=1 Tax=Arthrobacter sp. Leaf337 TaxID=1736342 RepID=UPI0006F9375C|nr:DUF6879 family protein [Arthrobacter sp. Leaf337]KQR82848.1 hypothetical protein ASF98_02275 [Arthrobacter sp. Leaf337]
MPDSDPFDSFQREAFRVEQFPTYDVPEEMTALDMFARSGAVPSEFNSDWALMVADAKRRGGVVRRLRVVSDPLTQYELFEVLAGYRPSVAAGEDIRIVVRGTDERIPTFDYWQYDEETVEWMDYSATGAYMGSRSSLVAEAERSRLVAARKLFDECPTVEQFCRSRELEWHPNQGD